ncbi:hypothetical protein [Maribacter sp.]|uniref:hypothetical protein n=1 Tax=Maribacter sp. TaxID=1897614 RepID=UPI0025C3811F|nr:hypothetical protein [Maribacter sp.]
MSIARKSKVTQTAGQLIGNFPGVEKSFNAKVHIQNSGDKDYNLWAVHPVLTGEAQKFTLHAYTLYTNSYNQKVRAANKEIKKQQQASEEWAENQPKAKQENIHFIKWGYVKNNTNPNTWEYNKKVEAYNTRYGSPILPMKRIQTIKQSTEKVFRTMLWEYAHQLFQVSKNKKLNQQEYCRPVYKMEINTKHLENTKDGLGLPMINYCADTILNHKERLIEAGVLLNNEFRGSQRGTKHHVNTQILCVHDDFEQKLTCTDNQLVKIFKPEVLGDTVTPTRAISKTIIKRDVHNFTSLDKDKLEKTNLNTAYPTDNFTGAPKGKMAKLPTPPTKKKTKAAENSEFLQEKIQSPDKLAQKLSQKEYEKADPLPSDALKYEATHGLLSRSEFRELLIQDLFKQFSKMYKNHAHFSAIFAGAWYTSIQTWLQSTELMNKNGHYLQKDKALFRYKCILFAIKDKSFGALYVARRTKFVVPAPNVYLNPKNNTPGTFGYHFNQVAKNSAKKIQAAEKIKSDSTKKAVKSKEYANNLRKLNTHIARFFNGKTDYQTLFQYVRDNMPREMQQDFHKHVENYKHNLI